MSIDRLVPYLLCISLLLSPVLAQESNSGQQTTAPPTTSAAPPSTPAQAPAAAPAPKPADPEVMGAVYHLDPVEKILKALPKEPAKVVTHRKGFSGAVGAVQIPGASSPFHVKAGQDLQFVAKCTKPEDYELFIFEVKGNKREALVSSAKAGFFGGVSTQRQDSIPLDITKYGEMSYMFKVKALQPGEYGFVAGWNVFHFVVDPI